MYVICLRSGLSQTSEKECKWFHHYCFVGGIFVCVYILYNIFSLSSLNMFSNSIGLEMYPQSVARQTVAGSNI